MMICKVSR